MHILECIVMLNYLLDQLQAGKRAQVPVATYNIVRTTLVSINKKIARFSNADTQFYLTSLSDAVSMVDIPVGSLYLTDRTRDALVEGINDLKSCVEMQAFQYFKINEFEPTEQIIPIMRDVVRTAAMKGAI